MRKTRRGFVVGLLSATLLAGALRFFRLDSVPISVYCDEAFSGYEAYCLLLTGMDSRGAAWPLFFDVFGKGWGEPLYIYATILPVWAFGLTAFAARFVAAAAGTLAVPATGLMTAAILRSAPGFLNRLAPRAGVASALLMACSPWPFHLSRVAFQASLLPLALAAAFWLIARALDRDAEQVSAGLLTSGALLLGASLYTYSIARLAMPLLAAGFLATHWRRIAGSRRATAVAALALSVLALPILWFALTDQGGLRFREVSIMARPDVKVGGAARAAVAVTQNYLSYFSPGFLLTDGDPIMRHSVRSHGMLHPHDVALLLIGGAACVLSMSRAGIFLLWWLISSPVAASLTMDPRHAVRSIPMQPGVFAVAGIGAALLTVEGGAPSRQRAFVRRALLAAIVAVAAISTAGYFHHYFVEYPIYSAPDWQYGLKQLYRYLEEVQAGHDSIYVQRMTDEPQSHFLFYSAFPPQEYQQHRFSRTRYLFDEDVFYRGGRIPNRRNPIFVMQPDVELPAGIQVRKVIKYPGGDDAYVVAW